MSVTIRPGTPADSPAIFQMQMKALADLSRRHGRPDRAWEKSHFLASYWERHQTLYEFLATSAEQFRVAEEDGQLIGYSRAVLEDGVRQLTELFVHPQSQSAGVGGKLLTAVFPAEGARLRSILSSPDIRAQARYLKIGVYPRFTAAFLFRQPEPVSLESDLTFAPATASPDTLSQLRAIDETILEFGRDAHHAFLLGDRHGLLVYRGEQVVGYCYSGKATGPIALLQESDFPAVFSHLENAAAESGQRFFGVETPLINRTAVDHLLHRGFRLDEFIITFMSDRPFGRFQNYIFSSPPLFL